MHARIVKAHIQYYLFQQTLINIGWRMENPITLEQQRKVWTIHQSVNGITYYYNRSTKKSQYEMPECFKITEEDLDHPDWKQYRTAQGKKFYYNALTRKSCWHMPAEVKEWKIKMEDQKRLDREKDGYQEEEPLTEAEQIRRKFMGLLKSKSITINTKWDSCIKICEDDDRWNLLKMSDKKRYFNDYISELRKISEMQQKAKTQANKVLFLKMLRENKNLKSDCKMHKVQFDFITDPRWRLLDGADKQNAFQDYMDELYYKQKEQARIERERNIEALKALLQDQEVKHDMKWDEFRSQFKNQQCYKKLHELDRINTFTKYIIEAEERFQANEVKQKRMKERTNRVEFRNMLKEKLFDGGLNYKTKWRSFVKDYKDDVRLLNMMDPDYKGSSAHEIFENFMDAIRKNHKVFKSEIKGHFKKVNFKMTEETPLSEFSDKLEELPLYKQAKQIHKQYFYHYFKQKIKSKNAAKQQKEKQKEKQKQAALKKAQKREKKIIFKIFRQFGQSSKSKYDISQYTDKIQQSLKEQNITISYGNIFKYYLEFKSRDITEDDKKSRDSSPSEKAKSKSRSSSSSRSKSERKKKKKKDDEKEKLKQGEREKQKDKEYTRKQLKINILENTDPVKSLVIPNELRQPSNHMLEDGEMQEEGEIKDDDPIIEEPRKQAEKPAQKSVSKDRSRSREKSKKKKKQKSAKKKKSVSSSDSD